MEADIATQAVGLTSSEDFSIFNLLSLEASDEIKPFVPASCGLLTQ